MLFVLFVVFLILKLVGVITWSWWLVTLPLWITVALTVLFWTLSLLGVGTALGLGALFTGRSRRRERATAQRLNLRGSRF